MDRSTGSYSVDDEAICNGLSMNQKNARTPNRKISLGYFKDYCHTRLAEGIFQEVIEGWEESDELKKDYAAM